MLRLTALCICLTTPFAVASDTPITQLPQTQLDWSTTPEGVAFAALEGDRFTSAYMAMVKLPGGIVSPPHVKTANMFGVVVQGTMTHLAHGSTDTAVELPAGSYYKVPKDLAHVSSCISAEPCVAFLYQDGKFDFLPVSE